LLIFDNTEHTTLQSSGSSTTEAADLADFLPQSKLCSVVFTTTNSDTAQALASQNIVALRELTLDAALRMLQVRLSRPLAITEKQEAKHLLKALSYLPLAVMQAAACINASGMTVREYRSRLDEHIGFITELSGDSSENKLQNPSVKDPVAASLSLSIDQIRCDNAFAADSLFLAACVDRKDISVDLLEASSTQAREDAIRILDKYALVTRRPAESALDVHRLVHQALRKRLQVQGRLIQSTRRAITQLLWVFPDDDHGNRSKWRRLLPHTQYALSHSPANDDDEDRLELASKCAIALYSDGRYEEAEELQVQVMQMRNRVLSDEHPHTLISMANLASTYRNQGRWKEAEELEVQVIETSKRVLSDEHPHTLTSMHNLAFTLQSQARDEEALALMERCFQLREQVLGKQHPDTQLSLNMLSSWRAACE
jgi:tetratricopeptide (TPR) repeat protein